MTEQTHTPDDPSSEKPIQRRNRWENSKVPERRCTAHKRNGDRCGNPAIHGGTVCGYHGGNAPAVKAKARLRLEMASDRLARQLLNMTTDPNVADPVKLAAIRDALDRSGIQAKTAVSVEVSTKPFELVFDKISSIPREPQPALAIEDGILDDGTDNASAETVDSYQVPGEIEDDPNEIDAEYYVIDEGTETPEDSDSSLSVDLGATPGPLGQTGPAGSGLLSLEDAVEAQASMRDREAARIRNMNRR